MTAVVEYLFESSSSKRGQQEDRCGDPLRDYERLLEDLHDLSVVAERRG